MTKRSCRKCNNAAHLLSKFTINTEMIWGNEHRVVCLKGIQPEKPVVNRTMRADAENCPSYHGGYWYHLSLSKIKSAEDKEKHMQYDLITSLVN